VKTRYRHLSKLGPNPLCRLTGRPRYRCEGFMGTGRPSCKAFFIATVGCISTTSTLPLKAPVYKKRY
jgi:hypothetical protein